MGRQAATISAKYLFGATEMNNTHTCAKKYHLKAVSWSAKRFCAGQPDKKRDRRGGGGGAEGKKGSLEGRFLVGKKVVEGAFA